MLGNHPLSTTPLDAGAHNNCTAALASGACSMSGTAVVKETCTATLQSGACSMSGTLTVTSNAVAPRGGNRLFITRPVQIHVIERINRARIGVRGFSPTARGGSKAQAGLARISLPSVRGFEFTQCNDTVAKMTMGAIRIGAIKPDAFGKGDDEELMELLQLVELN